MSIAVFLVGSGIVLVGVVCVVVSWRWERRYASQHPQRRRPSAAIAGRWVPVLLSLAICGVGARVLLSEIALTFVQHLLALTGLSLAAIAVSVVFLRWMRGRERTAATRPVGTGVLIIVAVLAVLAFGFTGTSN